MNFSIRMGTDHIDWKAVCEIIRRAPLGARDPDRLKMASQNSQAVCSAYADERVIGFGRALSDGCYQSAIYDLVVLPEFQKKGVGRKILLFLLDNLPENSTVLIYTAPGKQGFYRRLGFGDLITGMGRFAHPDLARAKGYLL